jgi:hypothetical protein
VLLGGVTFLAHQGVSSAKSQQASVTNQVAQVGVELSRLQPVLSRENMIREIQSNLQSQLTTDVSWKTMIANIAAKIPAGITFTAFSAQVTPPPALAAVAPPTTTPSGSSSGSSSATTSTTTPAPPTPTITGAITFQGTAKDYPTLATWIDSMNRVPQIGNVYVTSAQHAGQGNGLTFTATAVPTPTAQSNRLSQLEKAKP